MRSVFSRIAEMLVNIYLGGAESGIDSMHRPMSKSAGLRASGFATSAAPTSVPMRTFAHVSLRMSRLPWTPARLSGRGIAEGA